VSAVIAARTAAAPARPAGAGAAAGRDGLPPSVRRDFPALEQRVDDRPLVYLDSAATALKPRAVIEAVAGVYERGSAAVHRGVHRLAHRATEAYEGAREVARRFVGAASADEIVFVRSTTEALNLVAASWAGARLRPGDRVVVTGLEHHANLLPWRRACAQTGALLSVVPVDEHGEVPLDRFEASLGPGARLVALAHASNVLGTVLPVREMARLARARGAVVVVDGAQAAPHLRVDVQALGCDFYALSGHKLYGPSGVGVLWGRRELLAAMPPYQVGGGMVEAVFDDDVAYREAPHRFEAGTQNLEGALGLAAAMGYLEALGWESIAAHERALIAHAEEALGAVPGLRLLGRPGVRVPLFSFELDGVHAHDVATFLDAEGVAVRAGQHCAQPLFARLQVAAACRASFGVYTDRSDIDALAAALRGARGFFG
jgi:cysteine desulfurase / selenocysteine lyase